MGTKTQRPHEPGVPTYVDCRNWPGYITAKTAIETAADEEEIAVALASLPGE